MSNEHNNAHSQEQCNACLGTGRMVRDPDIGTDQECFVCDGAGYEPAQELGLTDEVVNDAAKVLAERFDYPWEHMPEEGRKNMRVHARAVVEAALRAKEAV